MDHTHSHSERSNGENWLFSRTGIATIVAMSVLGFLIYEGHGAHLLGYAPFLLILACPLMHIFMHGGHGGHSGHHHSDEEFDALKKQQATNAPQPGAQQTGQQDNQNHQHKGGCH